MALPNELWDESREEKCLTGAPSSGVMMRRMYCMTLAARSVLTVLLSFSSFSITSISCSFCSGSRLKRTETETIIHVTWKLDDLQIKLRLLRVLRIQRGDCVVPLARVKLSTSHLLTWSVTQITPAQCSLHENNLYFILKWARNWDFCDLWLIIMLHHHRQTDVVLHRTAGVSTERREGVADYSRNTSINRLVEVVQSKSKH